MNYALLVLAMAILVILTNIIVEVIKNFSGLKTKRTKFVTMIIAVTLTLVCTLAYCQIYGIKMFWYIIAGSFIAGFVVSYGAMFGFDKLYGELLDKIKELATNKKE